MKRWHVLGAALFLLTTSCGVGSALPAEPTDEGMMFGGQWTPANNTTSQTASMTDLKAVVEVFTATWCTNCVDVEHALEEVKNDGLLQQYHVHRSIGESEDPFGTDELDQRWKDKYGYDSPPTVVFNGTTKKIGSVADDGTLVNEFTNLASNDLALGNGTTMFTWTPATADATGTVAWQLHIDQEHLANHVLHVTLWVVEGEAVFEDGSNGLGTYPHVVHKIHDLGSDLNGTAAIELPEAHDGNDLEVHLIYELTPMVVEQAPEQPVEEDEDMPWVGSAWSIMTVALAAVVSQRTSVQTRN